MCGDPQTSFSRYWWVTTLPACWARICSSLYSFGVSTMRVPLSVTKRAARSIASGPALTIGSPLEARTFLRLVRAHRKHDQRHARPGAQAFEQLAAVHVRQAEIEDDEIGLLQRHPFE